MQVQVQVLNIRVRVFQIVLTRVRDVQNVSDTECLNHVSIASMMPVAKVQATWEYFIGVMVSFTWASDKVLTLRINTLMLVILSNLIKTTDRQVKLS